MKHEPIDFWLAKTAFYHRIGKNRMAVRCLRIAAQCRPSTRVALAISAAIVQLSHAATA